MITAKKKREENIAEYILYMWQVEDLIRANKCNMDLIEENIIPHYKTDKKRIKEIKEWWENLTEMIKIEEKREKGHLQVIKNLINDLNSLHLNLINSNHHKQYQLLYMSVQPLINELKSKTDKECNNEVELMLSAIYNSFLLKLKGDKVSEETNQALEAFSKLLAELSKKEKLEREGELEL
ncbi:DUF4924 family protein [Marinilabiliaceae bacterium ANBcel2]|nr:DUF4924 family protein [Marinilabiliaceae bacterium ANBcel2]